MMNIGKKIHHARTERKGYDTTFSGKKERNREVIEIRPWKDRFNQNITKKLQNKTGNKAGKTWIGGRIVNLNRDQGVLILRAVKKDSKLSQDRIGF